MYALTVFCCFVPFVASAIHEIGLPVNIHNCFEEERSRSNVSKLIGEVLFTKCVHKTLWVQPTSPQTETPLDKDARDWISGLVHMDLPNVDIFAGHNTYAHRRHKRQSGFGRMPFDRRGNGQFPGDRAQFPADRAQLQGDRGQFPADRAQFPADRAVDAQLPPDRQAGRQVLGNRRGERVSVGRGQSLRRQPRVRKEYRMLTDRERQLFHRALNMLKTDTVGEIF